MAVGRGILAATLGSIGVLIAGAAHAGDAPLRLLTVGGEAEVSAAPDRADVHLGIEASEKALADAEKKVADGVGRLLALCDGLAIARAQVRSAQLVVQPQYDQGSIVSGRPRIVGYTVSRQVDVDLRDLSRLGRLMQGAVDAGANRVSPPSFGSSRKDEYERAALAKAAEDARANAEVLARTMGVKLGALQTLAANGAESPPAPYLAMARSAMAGTEPGAGYEPGEIRFSASVTASFQLAP